MSIFKQLFKGVINLLVIGLVVSCSSQPVMEERQSDESHISDNNDERANFNPVLSREGALLYRILINKNLISNIEGKSIDQLSPEFLSQLFIKVEEPYNDTALVESGDYEAIEVYQDGAHPSYDLAADLLTAKSKGSLFLDDTFSDLLKNPALQGKILYTTDFDEQKFLEIAALGIKWVEESTEFSVKMSVVDETVLEYIDVNLELQHRPTLKLDKVIFFVNESAIASDLDSVKMLSRISEQRKYRLGLPYGKNKVVVKVMSDTGEQVETEAFVLSRYKAKPALHLVAIGINEYPYMPPSSQLVNAVNDADFVKNIFKERGEKIFSDHMVIEPYSLSFSDTTKESIEGLIERIKGKVKPNDYFLLYVASHGLINDGGYYFTPSDFKYSLEPNKINSAIIENGFGDDQISDYLINIPTIFRMAILDTCHAGKEVEHIKERLSTASIGKENGVSVLSAAKSTQLALDGYEGHGLFTYVLGQGLNGLADYNGDNIVDSIEIAKYVQDNVTVASRSKMQFEQDAVVMPNPVNHYSRRFELTQLKPKAFTNFQPNIFTPRESEIYINAIDQNNAKLMNGIIMNNTRHKSDETHLIQDNKISSEEITKALSRFKNVDINILFKSDRDQIDASERRKLESIAQALKGAELSGKGVFIEGHTDSVGEAEYNAALSQRRADAVTQMLSIDFGVDAQRLIALGMGEDYPAATNDSPVGRSRNRRVSVFIYDQ